MNQVFSRDGFKALRMSWGLLAVAIAACAGIIAASYWYAEKEKRDSLDMARRLGEARSRVDAARRERESLQESAEVFRTLVDRGVLQSERRLDVIELVNTLRARYQLAALDYEIAPQRILQLPGGRTFSSVDVLSSRVSLRARALHEGDLLGFFDGLEHNQQGFYLADHCTLRRLDVPEPMSLQPRVEADCTLEWVTLKEKHGGRPT